MMRVILKDEPRFKHADKLRDSLAAAIDGWRDASGDAAEIELRVMAVDANRPRDLNEWAVEAADKVRRDHNGVMNVRLLFGHDGANVCTFDNYDGEICRGESGRSIGEAVERCFEAWHRLGGGEAVAARPAGNAGADFARHQAEIDAALKTRRTQALWDAVIDAIRDGRVERLECDDRGRPREIWFRGDRPT